MGPTNITRRDFVNGVLAGSGAVLLTTRAPAVFARPRSLSDKLGDEWYGYGGVGDYASSHGNTPEVANTAHEIRNGKFASLPKNLPVDEEYDLVIAGGGMAGLGAAWHFKKYAEPGQRCLMLENHPIFGGESKENVFELDGERLVAPQGANGFFIPPEVSDPEQASGDARYYAEFNIPRELHYRELAPGSKDLNFCRDNYGLNHWLMEPYTSQAYFYETHNGNYWGRDIWAGNLANTPFSDEQREHLRSMRSRTLDRPDDEATRRWLDGMTYKRFLEQELKVDPAVTDYLDNFMSGNYGQGCDVISAYAAQAVFQPFTMSKTQLENNLEFFKESGNRRFSFPGGNSGYARYFLKNIKPEAIAGNYEFADIINGAINFDVMDRSDQSIRIRTRSTVVSVRHEGRAGRAGSVNIVYTRGGKLYRVRAKGVVMATGGWVNRHIVKDLPDEFRHAYQQFVHAPMIVANVALSNWRFMYEMGITGASWKGGFGQNCNIRPPMLVGERPAPLHPDKPIVLTFYVSLHTPGLTAREQGIKGRTELFFTTYSEYEQQIRAQMVKLFGPAGFKPDRDIRGIILNRWGHAYVVPTPGYLIDTAEGKSPRNVIKQGYGRIAFGHSELDGWQHWGPAADHGRRAVEQLMDMM